MYDEFTSIKDISNRLSELEVEVRGSQDFNFIEKATEEKRILIERKKAVAEKEERALKAISNGEGKVIDSMNFNENERGVKSMENITENVEVRALQKYISTGTKNLTEAEERSLVLSGSAAVLPIEIYNKLITDNKYSDLLSRATIINQGGAGKIYIPIASGNAATWKTELDPGTEASATLTKLELGGFELMRLLQLSGATSSMAVGDFENTMLELLGSEVVETLESSFVKGVGTTMPLGLSELTWATGTNQILTSGAAVEITAKELAEAISLLPQKYSRSAIILVNSDMMYQISQFKGTSEYAYNMETGATKFLGKEIVISEHIEDDSIYIVDPKELYVRFAAPLAIEADRSAGFTSASIFLRALTVVDAVWNQAATVRVGLGA